MCGGVSLYVMSHYFLRSSQNSPFVFDFGSLVVMFLGVDLFVFNLFGVLQPS